ncbi:suppressor of fused domain protein [Kribbella sp. NPDC058245]|uniref:suppressor of fused domain protein n=1 Tax=Kribbella sp. NPDC058245 TaxID=3346399 RepID=UPI0036EDE59F
MTRDSANDMTSLVEHFERVLGPIQAGWARDPDGAEMPFQIVRFSGGSDADSVGYATLGLSRYPLLSPTSGRTIRQELLMLAPAESVAPDRVALLLQVGSMALARQRVLLRGSVLGPADAIVPTSALTALYVTMPVYFPDEFATFAGADGDVVVAWLVPITTGEADFIASRGWDVFEDRLAEQDPDLVDFHRSGMKL